MNKHHLLRRIFSDTVLDLTDTSLLPDSLTLRCAFSRVLVRLPVDARITLNVRGGFCSILLPGRLPLICGSDRVLCGSLDQRAPRLYLTADCAFAALTFQMG